MTKRDDLKAKLLAQAETSIDRMLDDERFNEQMTLSEIEGVIGDWETDFRQRALEEIIAMQATEEKTCPLCGSQLLNKGKRKKRVVTLRGKVEVERPYYQCQPCQKGYFPPG